MRYFLRYYKVYYNIEGSYNVWKVWNNYASAKLIGSTNEYTRRKEWKMYWKWVKCKDINFSAKYWNTLYLGYG